MTESADSFDKQLEQAIGKFVVWFERVNMSINETLHEIIDKQGLKDDAHDYIEILLHDATANSMMNYFKGYIIHFYEDDLKDQQTNKYFHKLMEKMKEVIEFRNVILHSTFYFLDNDDKGELVYRWTAKRYGVNKTGLHLKIDEVNEDLIKLIREKAMICWNIFHIIRNIPMFMIPDNKRLNHICNEQMIGMLFIEHDPDII